MKKNNLLFLVLIASFELAYAGELENSTVDFTTAASYDNHSYRVSLYKDGQGNPTARVTDQFDITNDGLRIVGQNGVQPNLKELSNVYLQHHSSVLLKQGIVFIGQRGVLGGVGNDAAPPYNEEDEAAAKEMAEKAREERIVQAMEVLRCGRLAATALIDAQDEHDKDQTEAQQLLEATRSSYEDKLKNVAPELEKYKKLSKRSRNVAVIAGASGGAVVGAAAGAAVAVATAKTAAVASVLAKTGVAASAVSTSLTTSGVVATATVEGAVIAETAAVSVALPVIGWAIAGAVVIGGVVYYICKE